MAIEIKILGKCSAGTHVRCAIIDTVTGVVSEHTDYLPDLRKQADKTVEEQLIVNSFDKATAGKVDTCTLNFDTAVTARAVVK